MPKGVPRITAPYQTEDFAPILTFPITEAELAIKVAFNCGVCLPNFTALVDGSTDTNDNGKLSHIVYKYFFLINE